MKRAVFVLALLLWPALAAAQAGGWQTVVAPDLRFRLEMPAPVAKSTAEDRKSTRLNSSHVSESRMPSSA